jgi:alpha-beta hydrolase superfamily lysophospholipase
MAQTGRIKTENGLFLFYRGWSGNADSPVLLFIHGLGEHSGRYGHPVKYFGERGYAMYAYDQRGHGRSAGRRAHAENFARLLGDLDVVLRFIRKKEGKRKIFLIGHSFGGQVALTYGARFSERIDGVIASSPNLRLSMPVRWLKKKFGRMISNVLPTLSMDSGVNPKMISHDEAEVRAYEEDPLINTDITVRMASEMFENQDQMLQIARAFKIPCLLMHAGDDQISDPKGTEDFYAACASSDKSLKLYPGLYHELFNEVENMAVFSDIHNWLRERA